MAYWATLRCSCTHLMVGKACYHGQPRVARAKPPTWMARSSWLRSRRQVPAGWRPLAWRGLSIAQVMPGSSAGAMRNAAVIAQRMPLGGVLLVGRGGKTASGDLWTLAKFCRTLPSSSAGTTKSSSTGRMACQMRLRHSTLRPTATTAKTAMAWAHSDHRPRLCVHSSLCTTASALARRQTRSLWWSSIVAIGRAPFDLHNTSSVCLHAMLRSDLTDLTAIRYKYA